MEPLLETQTDFDECNRNKTDDEKGLATADGSTVGGATVSGATVGDATVGDVSDTSQTGAAPVFDLGTDDIEGTEGDSGVATATVSSTHKQNKLGTDENLAADVCLLSQEFCTPIYIQTPPDSPAIEVDEVEHVTKGIDANVQTESVAKVDFGAFVFESLIEEEYAQLRLVSNTLGSKYDWILWYY